MAEKELQYGATAKVFHWVMAALLAIQLPLGWLMPDIGRGMSPGQAMTLHVSIGITVLVLVVLRFLWRLAHPVASESHLPPWQRASSELVHWLLYVAVLLTTVTGWFFESARGWTIAVYGVVPLPHLVAEGSGLGRSIGAWHVTLVWVLVTLIGIHALSAVLHLAVYRDRVMHRMLPGSL
jgi:cytochrome b561